MNEDKKYNLLEQKCLEYYELMLNIFKECKPNLKNRLEKKLQNDPKEYARIGFYLLALEAYLQIETKDEMKKVLTNCITDTTFNELVFGGRSKTNWDFGVDAIYINQTDKKASLFNFTYTNKPKLLTTSSFAKVSEVEKFLNALYANNETDLNGKPLIQFRLLKEAMNNNEINDIEIIYVSNELENPSELFQEMTHIKNFSKSYDDIRIIPLNLNKIIDYILDKSKTPINAELLIRQKNCFIESSNGNPQKFDTIIAKIPITDIINITKNISTDDIEFNVLSDNIRGYLGNTTFNTSIQNSLEHNQKEFFKFNNGITIIADEIYTENTKIVKNISGNLNLKLINIKVVNGGQTLRSAFHFLKYKKNDLKSLSDCNVLVRIFSNIDNTMKNNIAKFTNTQNAIPISELRAYDPIQIQIEQFFAKHEINYLRRIGDLGKNLTAQIDISKIQLAQILYSLELGKPDYAVRYEGYLLNDYYEDIFPSNSSLDDKKLRTYVKYVQIFEALKKFISSKIKKELLPTGNEKEKLILETYGDKIIFYFLFFLKKKQINFDVCSEEIMIDLYNDFISKLNMYLKNSLGLQEPFTAHKNKLNYSQKEFSKINTALNRAACRKYFESITTCPNSPK